MLYPILLRIFIIICLATGLFACTTPTEQLAIGQQYFNQGDYHSAFTHLLPLARTGNPEAQYAVAYLYFYGQGTGQNTAEALKWMRAAANQGQPQASKALDLVGTIQKNQNENINPTFTPLPENYNQDSK